MKKINSIEELKQALEIEGVVVEGFILLKGNLRSSKSMCNIGNGQYSIINEIDDSEQFLSFEELNDESKTHIGLAVANGSFYLYGE